MELLRLGFSWVPVDGREAGRGFSGAAFWTAEVLSWGGLDGARGLSVAWAEEDGGSALSRPSGFKKVSERKVRPQKGLRTPLVWGKCMHVKVYEFTLVTLTCSLCDLVVP